jgi:putative endonuclease
LELPYCVYILLSEKDFLLYIGYTSDLKRRIDEHNQGRNLSTSLRGPLTCIFAEYFLFESDARRRESYFKTTKGKKAIRLMLKSTLTKLGYRANSMVSLRIFDDPQNDEESLRTN